MQPKIIIQNVSKLYPTKGETVAALKGIHLTIEPGEFTAIAGPSGSGKSTLLNLLGGLDQPTSGKILFGDLDITLLSDTQLCEMRLRSIGYIFQAYNLIPVLSVIENVEYVMLLQGVEPKARREKCLDILSEVGLSEHVQRLPLELSGGQQQRVAVARAIVSEPSLVLADEPTANLDSGTAGNLLDLMAELNQRRGVTFIFSSHDPLVLSRARRVVKLHDGQVQKE